MHKVSQLPTDVIHSARGATAIETFDLATACPRCDSTLGHVMSAQAQYATGLTHACHGCLLMKTPNWIAEPKGT